MLARTDRPGRIEDIVGRIAREIVGSQKALRAEVRLRAEFGLERWTPVSGKRGEETYTLIGIAHACVPEISLQPKRIGSRWR